MGESQKRVILYGYYASPFFLKTLNLLSHYRVEYDLVKTGFMPPRPMLSEELNITYRRIPIISIDGQFYLDTSLIAKVLDETFGGKPGHGPSLLQQQGILQRRLTLHWSDQQLFPIGAMLIPAKGLTKEFINDRVSFGVKFMGKVPPEESKAQLRLHLASLEEQLKANEKNKLGPYLLGTQEPQLVDIAGPYTTLNWIQSIQRSAPEYLPMDSTSSTPFPAVVKYMATVRSHIEKGQSFLSKPQILDPKKAAKMITEAGAKVTKEFTSTSSNVDELDPLVKAGKLKYGNQVEVTPVDTGRVPQAGELVGLSTDTITLLVKAGQSASNAPFLIHTPRNGFKVEQTKQAKL